MIAGSRQTYVAVIGALFICEVAATFETSMIFAAMAKLVQEFGDPAAAGWLITSYLLVGAGSAAVIGRLGDLYGRRSLMIGLLAAGVVGSLISAFSQNYALMLTGRCLQGLTAAMLPLCFGLLREHLPPKLVSLGIGLMISAAGVGTLSGLLIGGLIVDNLPWRMIFLASATLAAIAVAAGLILIPPGQRQPSVDRPDYVGGLIFVPGIALILLGISKGSSWGWTSAEILACFATGLLFLAVWIRQSLRHPFPLIDVRLFSNRNILIGNIAMGLIAAGSFQIILVFSLLLQQPEWTGVGLGVSATETAFVKLPSNIFALFAGPIAGILALRVGDRFTLSTAAMLIALGWFVGIWLQNASMEVAVVLIIVAFGTAMAYGSLSNIIVQAAPPDRTSEAAGMMAVIRTACMGAGAQLVAVMLATDTIIPPDGGTERYPSKAAYDLVMISVTALCVLVAALAFLLSRRIRAPLVPRAASA